MLATGTLYDGIEVDNAHSRYDAQHIAVRVATQVSQPLQNVNYTWCAPGSNDAAFHRALLTNINQSKNHGLYFDTN